MPKGKLTDLFRAYPELAPDPDYPPLRVESLKGKVRGMDDLSSDPISAYIPGTEEFLLNRTMGLLDPSYRN